MNVVEKLLFIGLLAGLVACAIVKKEEPVHSKQENSIATSDKEAKSGLEQVFGKMTSSPEKTALKVKIEKISPADSSPRLSLKLNTFREYIQRCFNEVEEKMEFKAVVLFSKLNAELEVSNLNEKKILSCLKVNFDEVDFSAISRPGLKIQMTLFYDPSLKK